jgi:uncharacterized protein
LFNKIPLFVNIYIRQNINKVLTIDEQSDICAVMNIVVTGSSGLVGGALTHVLRSRGDEVTPIVRKVNDPTRHEVAWDADYSISNPSHLEQADAVVHLAGESIATGRWTSTKKERILSSRVNSTHALASTLTRLKRPPRVLVCASAIGFYGSRGAEALTETSAAGQGFLARVCRAWEAAADAARQYGIRVVHLRFGMILSSQGGALKKILTPFRLGAGGIIGNGRQYWSWVMIEDVVRAISFAVERSQLVGPVNVVTPNPVTNREFTKTLGRVLHRPTLFPVPASAARLALGEMADELLLASTRVMPAALTAAGFRFQHPQLEGAFHAMLNQTT